MIISGYDCWKRKGLSQCRKLESVGAETTSSGSPFQIRGPETLKVRLPTVDSWNIGTTTTTTTLWLNNTDRARDILYITANMWLCCAHVSRRSWARRRIVVFFQIRCRTATRVYVCRRPANHLSSRRQRRRRRPITRECCRWFLKWLTLWQHLLAVRVVGIIVHNTLPVKWQSYAGTDMWIYTYLTFQTWITC